VVQAGASAFINGELVAAIPKPLPMVYDATDQAIRQLEFTISAAQLGEVNGYIYAKQIQGRRIEITCQKKTPVVTEVSIRVGVFGDQPLARLILATMQSKLSPGVPTTEQSASVFTP
jgi:hypothetical protein